MKKRAINNIPDEIVAAFLDGNATANESRELLDALTCDAELRELLHISQSVDTEMGFSTRDCEFLPMAAMAATTGNENLCSLECEKYILNKLDIAFNEEQLLDNAIQKGWQKKDGTALHNIGRHLEEKGLVVTRRYKCCIDDILEALEKRDFLIAAVDGGELLDNNPQEGNEDILAEIPDHTVVIISCNKEKGEITIYDPNSMNREDTYPIGQFINAWNDSKNYLITTNTKNMKTYTPKPIDISDVELTEDLNELREAIAENAHDVWAIDRIAQGWSYGPQRDDAKKETPCMVPYSQLPESEKDFDRKMAINTIKLLKKLGYDLIKREDTELYKVLKERIRNSQQEFHCSHCGNVIYKHQVFCDQCGVELEIEWE